MDAEEMKKRTKKFAIDIGHLILKLERNDINRNYCNQLIRCSVLLQLIIELLEELNLNPILLTNLKLSRKNWMKVYYSLNYLQNLMYHTKAK